MLDSRILEGIYVEKYINEIILRTVKLPLKKSHIPIPIPKSVKYTTSFGYRKCPTTIPQFSGKGRFSQRPINEAHRF